MYLFNGFQWPWTFSSRNGSTSTGSYSQPNSMSSAHSHRAYMVPPSHPHYHPHPHPHYHHAPPPQAHARGRTASTPGHSAPQPQRGVDSRPEMSQVNSHYVSFANGPSAGGSQPRSRSVPRPTIVPTDAHVQAYARYQAEAQMQSSRTRVPSRPNPQHPQGTSTHKSQGLRPVDPQNQTRESSAPQSHSRPKPLTPHQLQGSRTHQSQGSRIFASRRPEQQADEFGRQGRPEHGVGGGAHPRNDSVPSLINLNASLPSLVEPSNPAPAPTPAPTGVFGSGLGRLARPLRYGLTRTDSGSRKVHGRSQSVDAANRHAHSGESAGPSYIPLPAPAGPAPQIPHHSISSAAAPQIHPRGRTGRVGLGLSHGLIHLVHRHRNASVGPTVPAARPTTAPTTPAPPIPYQNAPSQSISHLHRPRPHPHHTLPVPATSKRQESFVPPPPSQVEVPTAPSLPSQASLARPRQLRKTVSFVNPHKKITLNINPLFAASPSPPPSSASSSTAPPARAPIYYDVTLPPSRISVRCRSNVPEDAHDSSANDESGPSPRRNRHRSTHTEAVPDHLLSQPATEPPTKGKLMLKCDRLPWVVIVPGGCSSVSANASASAGDATVTNNDILFAVYHTLNTLITPGEWGSIPASSSSSGSGSLPLGSAIGPPPAHLKLSQKRVSKAYHERLDRMEKKAALARAQASLRAGRRVGYDGDGEEGDDDSKGGDTDRENERSSSEGVRRVDWLMGRTRLVGIVMEKDVDVEGGIEGVGKLIFEKP